MSQSTVISALVSAFSSDAVAVQFSDGDPYIHDNAPDVAGIPLAVVFAESAADVQTTLRIARQYDVPVVARGAGTGTTGGAVSDGGIVLSLERMNQVIEVDVASRVAVVEPGVVTGELQRAVEDQGLFYPPDPASLDTCTIGGNIAENAGGPRCMKYGVTRDYVLG
ncbi:MAG: FAD-binding oxidoreductase, partial [Candidatus Margulisiibacteriota bacterium]